MILISQKIHAKEVDLTGTAEHFCGGGGERVGVLTSDFKLEWGIEETLLLVSLYFLEKLGGGGREGFFPSLPPPPSLLKRVFSSNCTLSGESKEKKRQSKKGAFLWEDTDQDF